VIPPHRAASRAKWETGLIRVNVHDLAVWDAYDCVSFPAFWGGVPVFPNGVSIMRWKPIRATASRRRPGP
jgi:hypothetical protein